MTEQWKLFHKSTRYDWFISDQANIKRVNSGIKNNGKIKMIKTYITGGVTGSRYQAISINSAPDKYLHRIVAKAFIANPDNKETVNHKDANKLNNSVSNLEWASYTENAMHANSMGINVEHARSLTYEQALEIRELWVTTDLRLIDLAKMYEVYSGTIKNIVKFKTYKEKGEA